jgi:Tol biopolymer transport system component
MVRLLTVFGIAALALAAWMMRDRGAEADTPMPRTTYVATAHQQGVVGYRDPVGVLAPDGQAVAYSEGRFVRVTPIKGGLSPRLPAADGQVRWIAWLDRARLVVEDTGAPVRWWVYPVDGSPRHPLWSAADIQGVRANDLRQLVASPDGAWLAGIASGSEGPRLWRAAADGSRAEVQPTNGRPSWPAWMPSGELACILTVEDRGRIAAPCSGPALVPQPDVEAVGPIAVSPDGATVYFASPNANGMVDLWTMDRQSRRARRVSSFDRDTYAPSVAADGTVLFKTQSYRTFVAEADGQAVRQLTAFQAETPWWHPREPLVSFTYGTWRRVMDDANYPDIAQEIGVVNADGVVPANEPMQVVADSDSEDQAMAWSPNGRWIALHSHREMSDDVWLRPVDGSAPDRRITMLGRGAEVGWPRWSPAGTTVLLDGANREGRSVAYVIGVDQETGSVTSELKEIATPGIDGDIMHAEWLPDGRRIAAVIKEAPGRHALITVPLAGGGATVVHRVASEHDFPGMTVSPDGAWIGFVGPAPDGYYQIFRVPVSGGPVELLTTDSTHKTQPAWSPDGHRLAFTVWSYTAQFWTIQP